MSNTIPMDAICAVCGFPHSSHAYIKEYCPVDPYSTYKTYRDTVFKLKQDMKEEKKRGVPKMQNPPPPAQRERTYTESEVKELAVDFAWENTFDHSEGYQKVRKTFDEWLKNNSYHNNQFKSK